MQHSWQEKQHPAASRANNKNKASVEQGLRQQQQWQAVIETRRGATRTRCPGERRPSLRLQQQQDTSDAPDPSGRDAPTPASDKNNGRKRAPSATMPTSRREAYLSCRRGWIIVLNTRRSHNQERQQSQQHCLPVTLGDCGAYSRRCAITKKKQPQGRSITLACERRPTGLLF